MLELNLILCFSSLCVLIASLSYPLRLIESNTLSGDFIIPVGPMKEEEVEPTEGRAIGEHEVALIPVAPGGLVDPGGEIMETGDFR